MKKSKGVQFGAMLVATLLLFVALASMPASAYDATGHRWEGTSANYGWDWLGSVPSDWKNPIRNAASAWNSAGSEFSFQEDFWTGNIYKVSLGSSGPPADATIWFYSGTTTILDSRMRFNSEVRWSTIGEWDKYDVQNVATHEFGHWLRLNDLYGSGNTEKTMYHQTDYGEIKKRTLDQDDKDGIKHIYG